MKYHEAQGVAQNFAEAIKWYKLAAAQGHPTAQTSLGYMYDRGHGVAQDQVEAVHWYKLGATQGQRSAQYNLGVMYAEGKGVARDHDEAERLFRRAIANPDANPAVIEQSRHSLRLIGRKVD